MTGPGFVIALYAFLEDRRRSPTPDLTLDQRLAIYEFVQFCTVFDLLEDWVVSVQGLAERNGGARHG